MKADILIGKYKESLYIQPKNEAIVGCFIETNDHEKDKNSISLPMNRENFFKKSEQRKVSGKDKRNISEPFSKLQKNEKMSKMSKFKRTSETSL